MIIILLISVHKPIDCQSKCKQNAETDQFIATI